MQGDEEEDNQILKDFQKRKQEMIKETEQDRDDDNMVNEDGSKIKENQIEEDEDDIFKSQSTQVEEEKSEPIDISALRVSTVQVVETPQTDLFLQILYESFGSSKVERGLQALDGFDLYSHRQLAEKKLLKEFGSQSSEFLEMAASY